MCKHSFPVENQMFPLMGNKSELQYNKTIHTGIILVIFMHDLL